MVVSDNPSPYLLMKSTWDGGHSGFAFGGGGGTGSADWEGLSRYRGVGRAEGAASAEAEKSGSPRPGWRAVLSPKWVKISACAPQPHDCPPLQSRPSLAPGLLGPLLRMGRTASEPTSSSSGTGGSAHSDAGFNQGLRPVEPPRILFA